MTSQSQSFPPLPVCISLGNPPARFQPLRAHHSGQSTRSFLWSDTLESLSCGSDV